MEVIVSGVLNCVEKHGNAPTTSGLDTGEHDA
jgi:hypothetical protein